MNKKLNLFSSIKFLSKYTKKYYKNFIVFNAGWLVSMFLKIYIPITFAIMIDEIVYYKNISVFFNVSIIFMIMLVFSSLLLYFNDTQYVYTSIMFSLDVKKDVFDKTQIADAKFMADANTGDIINNIQEYAGRCNIFILLIHIINNTLLLVLYIIYVFLLGWQIGLLMMIIVPISVLVSLKYGKKIRDYSDKQRSVYGVYSGWLYEILSGLKDIRLLGAQHKVKNDFLDNQKKLINLNIKNSLSKLTSESIITTVNLIIKLSIFSVAAYMTVNGNLTIGILILILTYFTNMSGQARMLSAMYLGVQNDIAYVQRIYDFLNAPTEKDWQGKDKLNISNGNIVFDNIEFVYDNSHNIINGLSLDIKSDEKIALVGKSGTGKTTLAYMLIGFYSPQKGNIIIDNQKISDCTLKSIRNNIGIIQQDTLLFDGSIRDNLILGKRNATDDEIISACRRAEIHEFISSLPDGYNTIVGTNGLEVSGGQRQRIAISRIYLKNPKIIIFDEATSSLDDETEEQIHKSWEKVLMGRTAIVIAHRLSSVMLCDKVAVIDEGVLAEIGTPNDLMKNNKLFKELFAIKEGEDDK